MNNFLIAIICGILSVGIAWADNTIIRSNEEGLSQKTMLRFFILGCGIGYVASLLISSGTEQVVKQVAENVQESFESLDLVADSIKTGRPSF